MSATVEEVILYSASCDECMDAFEHENEDRALEWAANHDAENHEDDDPDEIARQEWKDSRYDD